MLGKLFAIGVGPGDPKLMTVKAIETIQTLDVIYTPQADVAKKSVALTIAEAYLPEEIRIEARHFPMVNDLKSKMQQWESISKEIQVELEEGFNVGFLTLGDPSTYSTFSYLLERMDFKFNVEVIPGVTSFAQIAAISQKPLVLDQEKLCILPATASQEEIHHCIELYENLVIMKVKRHLKKILPILKAFDLLGASYLISDASMPSQKIYKNLETFTGDEKLSYFSTIIVQKKREEASI
ncbi:precorrin-2 C(20)-methyltransferase [Facklamia sp. DSM 111018]|uniref:Precorrin-2 C(20)-methyltransferase n=1 Tax=Facklamia lactis TaxID=2749967 RepID=A0ABS0LNT8_9LACT|nr:precorrin-2 C(20)-methyltransferase [Facklamia lactis]MBG9985825.1 precorrin-2 C(20)-methyltransferase [Facklamia lactis]